MREACLGTTAWPKKWFDFLSTLLWSPSPFEPWLFLGMPLGFLALLILLALSRDSALHHSDPRDALTEVEMIIYIFGLSCGPIVGWSDGIWYKWSYL